MAKALCNAKYTAQQIPGAVVIVAKGDHPTTGFKVWFERSLIDVYPPEHSLRHETPSGPVAEVVTPFSVYTVFPAGQTIKSVTVHDAEGRHDIGVEQVLDLAGLAGTMAGSGPVATFGGLPLAQSKRLIDFEDAAVTGGIVGATYFLTVWGTKPYLNMEVALSPLVYIVQPEYWGIEVVGSLPGIALPTLAPYVVTLPLAGIRGTKGIEVVGATSTKRIAIP